VSSSDFALQSAPVSPAHGFVREAPLSSPEGPGASATYDVEEATATEAYRAEEAPGVLEATELEETATEASQSRPVSYSFSETIAEAAPETRLPEEAPAYGLEGEAAVAMAPAEAAPRTGQITLDQLSPEAIDAIARRAVELLSTKVVEEVAWEVVPQLAELLIKRKLEEEKAQ
jgi:hypothetical protein